MKSCSTGEEPRLMFTSTFRMARKNVTAVTLTLAELLVPDGPVCVFQKGLISWDFHTPQATGFTRNDAEKQKNPSIEQQFFGSKCKSGDRRMASLVQAWRENYANSTNQSEQLWWTEKHLMSLTLPLDGQNVWMIYLPFFGGGKIISNSSILQLWNTWIIQGRIKKWRQF